MRLPLLATLALLVTLGAAIPAPLRTTPGTDTQLDLQVRAENVTGGDTQAFTGGDTQGETGVEQTGTEETAPIQTGTETMGTETTGTEVTATETEVQPTETTGAPLPSGTAAPEGEGGGEAEGTGTGAAPTPTATAAPEAPAALGQWTIASFTRACDASDTACSVSFGIDTGGGDASSSAITPCSYTQAGGSRAAVYEQVCGAFTVSSQWSGQFGEGEGFTTLSVVDKGRKLIVWPAYTDKQLEGGGVVSPDQSYPVSALP